MITQKIKKLLSEQKLGYVATVSLDGTPNLSPKGTIIAWDQNTLAFANIHSPQTVKNLKNNPSIEINVVDPFSRRGKSSIKSIVLVRVERVSEILSPLYDIGYTEEEMKTKWRKYYLSF